MYTLSGLLVSDYWKINKLNYAHMTDYSVLHMHLICALPQRVPTKVTDLFDDDLSLTHKELPYLKNLQFSSWFWVMIKQTVTSSLQVCGISKKISWGNVFLNRQQQSVFLPTCPFTIVLILSRGIVIKIMKKLLLLVKIQPELRPTP